MIIVAIHVIAGKHVCGGVTAARFGSSGFLFREMNFRLFITLRSNYR